MKSNFTRYEKLISSPTIHSFIQEEEKKLVLYVAILFIFKSYVFENIRYC